MGAGERSIVSIWQPFAGYGQRGRHVSWLLDNLGEKAESLRDAVSSRFFKRGIPGAQVESRTLTGRGVATECRPYYLVRRGIVTVGLYITRLGHDLYISQVTYAKGPISLLRVIVLSLMSLLMLAQVVFPFLVAGQLISELSSFSLYNEYSRAQEPDILGAAIGFLGTILCCVGPLAILNPIALFLAAIHSIYKAFADRDPFALLRTPPNEFQQDDIIALEKAVEETVRQSLDTVGVDAALMPPAPEYGMKRRLI